MRTNRWTVGAMALAAGLLCCGSASAEDWPTRPVTMIVPYAPGGNIDQAARLFARELSEKLGQQFIIESKGGAGGAIGATAGREGQARRLHPAGDGERAVRPQQDALRVAALRSGHRFHADLADQRRAPGVHRQSEVAGQRPQGSRGARQREEGRADDRPSRRRHRRASDRDLVCQPRRDQRHSGGLSRRAADRHGGARRRDRRRPAGLYPAGPFRQGHRGHLGRAGRFPARRADRPRERRRQCGVGHLHGARRAGRRAARDRHQDEPHPRRVPQDRRGEEAVRDASAPGRSAARPSA